MTKAKPAPVEEISLAEKPKEPARKRPRFSIPSAEEYSSPDLKVGVISLWLEDVLDKSMGIKFNADVSHARLNKNKIMGDAALFLAARYAPIQVQDDDDLLIWLDEVDDNLHRNKSLYSTSVVLINRYTRIPLHAAEELINPKVMLALPDYCLSSMKPRDFATTLRNYLITGTVSWDWLPIALEERAIEAAKAKEAKLAALAAAGVVVATASDDGEEEPDADEEDARE